MTIPVTILTGFLGAGKTTLLRRVLNEKHSEKIAVIENEFGAGNIDSAILVQTEENIFQMNNGCVCCTIREDLRATLADLAQQRRAGKLQFDRVVIETTGLAEPGPVAQTFFVDEDVAATYALDAVITVVDAVHGQQQLSDRQEARKQVGFADHLLISKTDLVTARDVAALEQRLQQMNPRAPRHFVDFGSVDLAYVFDLHGFNLNAKLELDPEFTAAPKRNGAAPADDQAPSAHGAHCEPGCGHAGHGHEHDPAQQQLHDDVQSFVYRTYKAFDARKLEEFLTAIVNIYGPRMLRYKGVLHMNNTPRKVIFQGVHQLMGTDLGLQWPKNEPKESRMVFIGIDMPRDILEKGLGQCLVE